MFCSSCGKESVDGSSFCQNCGAKFASKHQPINSISTTADNTASKKNYSPIFWKYFGVGVLISLWASAMGDFDSPVLGLLLLVVCVLYVYGFCKTINEAMAHIGKKNWWPLGLLSLVPFGFWVVFFIVRSKLLPHGLWISQHKSFRLTK